MSTIGNFSANTKILSSVMNSKLNSLGDGTGDDTSNSLQRLRKYAGGLGNFIVNGFTIPTSANLTATISTGEAYVNGKYVNPSSTVKTFTASKDTYVDLKDDGTFSYVEVTLAATTGMTLSTNSDGTNALRIGKCVSSASALTTIYQTNQNWETNVNQSNTDPLGNIIFPQSPTVQKTRTVLPARTNLTATRATPASVKIIMDRGGWVRVKYIAQNDQFGSGTVDSTSILRINGADWINHFSTNSGNNRNTHVNEYEGYFAAGAYTFDVQVLCNVTSGAFDQQRFIVEVIGER